MIRPLPPPPDDVGVGVADAVGCRAIGGPTTRTSPGGGAAAAGVLASGEAIGAGSADFCADSAAGGLGWLATAVFGPAGGGVVGAAAVGAATIAGGSADGLISATAPGNRDAMVDIDLDGMSHTSALLVNSVVSGHKHAARQFIGMCQNHLLKARLCNAMAAPTSEEIDREVLPAVNMFLAAYGTGR